MAKIELISGIGPANAEKLRAAGINSVSKLLAAASTPDARKALAEKTGFSSDALLEWANRADLHRIKGVGEQYSDLLEAAGVDTVVELAHRNADNLIKKLVEVNEAKKLVRKMPTAAQVGDWVSQAKALPRMLHY